MKSYIKSVVAVLPLFVLTAILFDLNQWEFWAFLAATLWAEQYLKWLWVKA